MALTPNTVNQYLNEALDQVAAAKDSYVKNPGVDFTQNRKLPFKTMMSLILDMSGGSLTKEMIAFWDRTNVSVTKSAFVQQRDKIRPEAFTELFKAFNTLCAPAATMYGRRLCAFDGTAVNIAPNPGTETYIERKDQTGFSQYHLNAAYDLCSNVYTDYLQQEAHAANEQKAACQMVDRMSATTKTVAIFDRGYEGYNLIAHVQEAKNVDILLRMKEKGGILSGISDLPDGEFDIDYEREVATTQTKEDKAKGRAYISTKKNKSTNYSPKTKYREWDFPSPFKVKFRIVRFTLKNGATETILTTLPRNEFPPKVLKELYNWLKDRSLMDIHGEDYYRRTDHVLYLDGARGATPRFISDFAHMLNAEEPWDRMTSGEILAFLERSIFAADDIHGCEWPGVAHMQSLP